MRRLSSKSSLATFLVVLASCSVVSCTSVRLDYELASFDREIQRLGGLIAADSTNAAAQRELGVIYVKSGHVEEGLEYLRYSHALDPDNDATQFYLGLAFELVGDRDNSLALYEQYTTHARLSPYRSRMRGRYEWLSREKATAELQSRLRDEASLGLTSSDAVAVFPFTFQGTDERFAPLGLGLAELLMIDLLQVAEIKLVERTRLQALLDEIAFSEGVGADLRNGPRSGRLIGAGILVVGSFNLLPNDELSVETTIVDLKSPDSPVSIRRTDNLDDLFRLQKELVFAILDGLGVTPTPVERKQIEDVPTSNLQAFLAFSRGIENQRAGRLQAAAASYRRAANLDPNFAPAIDRNEAVEGLVLTKGDGQDTLDNLLRGEGSGAVDITDERIRKLGANIHANVVPGPDRRNPIEPFLAPPSIPDPPPPPANKRNR